MLSLSVRLLGRGLESFRDVGQPAVRGASRHARSELGLLFEHSYRAPERLIEHVSLPRLQILRRVLMADVTLVPCHAPIHDLPQRAAAVGAREPGRVAEGR